MIKACMCIYINTSLIMYKISHKCNVHMCTYVHAHPCMHVYVWLYVHVCMHVCMYVCMFVPYVCVLRIRMYKCMETDETLRQMGQL